MKILNMRQAAMFFGLFSVLSNFGAAAPAKKTPREMTSKNASLNLRNLNEIQIENLKPGTADWRLRQPAVHHEIEGYASATSIDRGESIDFFVSVKDGVSYRADVYRMGWYDGLGARLVHSFAKLRGHMQRRPWVIPKDFQLAICDWDKSFTLQTEYDENWITGIYLVKLTAVNGFQSYMIFTLRDDASSAPVVFQQSVTTYQAYNNWGHADAPNHYSLYDYNSSNNQRANRVSFDRPYGPGWQPSSWSGVGAGEFLTTYAPDHEDPDLKPAGWEYNTVRYL